MKKIFWLASALGISVTAAHAQTGSIKIESASGRTIYITNAPKDDTKVMSGSQLDAEIDDLMASNNSRSSFSGVSSGTSEYEFLTATYGNANSNYSQSNYSQTYQAYQSYSQNNSMVGALNGESAPAIAARAASRAAHGRSTKRCALYVRKALQSAGYKFTPQPSAYQYAHGTLAGAGFTRISSDNYMPQIGDVVVFNLTSKNPHGHIQIYDGTQWVSDFRQGVGKFSPYAQHNGYSVWRDLRYTNASSSSRGTYLAMNEQ
ncbi:MAG: CHAP domain-containing protein [Moraxella sp.]